MSGDRSASQLALADSMQPHVGKLILWLEMRNTTSRTLAVERMDVLIAPKGFHAEPFAAWRQRKLVGSRGVPRHRSCLWRPISK